MSRKPFTTRNINRTRGGPGVYKLYAKNAKKPTYIGSSENLPERLMSHKHNRRFHSFKVHHTHTGRQARAKEENMIRRNRPRRNRLLI